jgi:hypothetical protein
LWRRRQYAFGIKTGQIAGDLQPACLQRLQHAPVDEKVEGGAHWRTRHAEGSREFRHRNARADTPPKIADALEYPSREIDLQGAGHISGCRIVIVFNVHGPSRRGL